MAFAEVAIRGAVPTLLTASSQTIVTAPSTANTWVVARVTLAHVDGTDLVTVTVGKGTANSDTVAKRRFRQTLNAGDVREFDVYLQGDATPQLLYAFASVANVVTASVDVIEGTN